MAGPRRQRVSDPQVVRALALLLEMARARRGILLNQFAKKRGYDLRGVYRARDALIKAGAPIRRNRESTGRWQLLDGWLPPALIGAARDELIALFVARHLAPGLRGTPVGRALESLWSKLAVPGPQQELAFGAPAPYSVRALAAIDYQDHHATIEVLTDAIARHHAVRIAYRSADGKSSDRVVEPGFLHWDGGLEAMYVPSWCRHRQAVRVFAVHRIAAIEPLPTEAATARPARRALERAFRVWYRDRVEHVEIHFTPDVAAEIRERRWHASQRIVEARDGGLDLHLDVSAPEELERWLLGYGPDARVIAPARLAEQIRTRHAQAAGVGQVIVASQPPKPRDEHPGAPARVQSTARPARRGT